MSAGETRGTGDECSCVEESLPCNGACGFDTPAFAVAPSAGIGWSFITSRLRQPCDRCGPSSASVRSPWSTPSSSTTSRNPGESSSRSTASRAGAVIETVGGSLSIRSSAVRRERSPRCSASALARRPSVTTPIGTCALVIGTIGPCVRRRAVATSETGAALSHARKSSRITSATVWSGFKRSAPVTFRFVFALSIVASSRLRPAPFPIPSQSQSQQVAGRPPGTGTWETLFRTHHDVKTVLFFSRKSFVFRRDCLDW
jgi:hypothetical protein